MKTLKIILLFSIILYVYVITSNLIYKTNLSEGEIKFNGVIEDITIKANKINLIVKNKEKLLVTYYVNSLEELNNFEYELGDEIEIDGVLVKPSTNTLFNQFNYQNYLLSKKIYFILKAESIKKVKDNKNIFYSIKNKIIERIENLNSREYLKTFILGDKSELDDIKTIYQENGISHLLAISGMHITLLSNVLLFILNNFTKKSHSIISLFLLFYAFLTNFTPSVIRAVLFFIFSKVKIKKDDLLLIIAGIMLIYNPYYIYNVGFLFSFIISLFLILFGNITNKYKNYFVKLFVTSVICFLASLPILINNFYYINITSPLLNIFFVPFVSMIIFPLSLLTIVFPFLDNLLLFLTNILEVLSKFGNHFNINLIMCRVPIYIFIIYYIVIYFSFKNKKILVLLIIIIMFHNNIRYFNNTNYLTMIDVGQGDSILLEIENGSILIDTGGVVSYNTEKWRETNYSIVINKTIPYLKSLGIKKLNYLIITHGDFDHIGEAINLINNFEVENVILNSGYTNKLESNLIKVLNEKNIKYKLIEKDIINFKGVDLKFINDKDKNNENEDSLILHTNISNRNILFMGDAGKVTENYIMNAYNLPKMDILKVGHHGSNSSSDVNFIKKISPEIGLISVGKNNRFGHPSKEVINILNENNVTTYMTSIDGSVRINLNDLEIYTCLKLHANAF